MAHFEFEFEPDTQAIERKAIERALKASHTAVVVVTMLFAVMLTLSLLYWITRGFNGDPLIAFILLGLLGWYHTSVINELRPINLDRYDRLNTIISDGDIYRYVSEVNAQVRELSTMEFIALSNFYDASKAQQFKKNIQEIGLTGVSS